MVAVDQVGRPRGGVGRRDDGIEVEFGERVVDRPAGRAGGLLTRLGARRAGDRRARLRREEDLLAEVAHLFVAVLAVEGDQAGQRLRVPGPRVRLQVVRDVVLELAVERGALGAVRGVDRDVRGIDDRRAERLQPGDGAVHDRIGLGGDAEVSLTPYADAGPLQGV